MSPRQLSEQLERLLTDDLYERQLTSLEATLYTQIINETKKLEVDKDGFIKQSQANRKLLTKITLLTNRVLRELKGPTERQVKKIAKIDKLNQEYFYSFSKFKPNRAYISALQRQTIEEISSYILQDGLQANFITPLKQILNRNINSGGSYSGFLEELKIYIKGTEQIQGSLTRYANVWLKDTLFNYSRAYQQSVTADLGLVWYLYQGGLVKDSREFCVDRAGHYFHESEIKAWASLEWAGKRKGTTESSIFTFVGGWNCNHFLIPVSDVVVPADDLARLP
jgi:hypothetical protein